MKIGDFEAYLRVGIAYAPFIFLWGWGDSDEPWLPPLLYFMTMLWGLPFFAFTENREMSKQAQNILDKGLAPIGAITLGMFALSGLLFVLFGGGRW